MANYDLGTIGYTIQNTGAAQATAEISGLVNAAERQLSPAAQKVIDNMTRTREAMRRVEQSTQNLNRAFTSLELRQAAQRMQGFEAALVNTRGNMNNFGVVTQQAGYQVGDFLVQVQSGTNWMVALGQQATQLVGVLPMMTGLFGLSTTALVGLSAGLGIAIPLITAVGAYFLRAAEGADKASEATKGYEATLQDLNSSLSETNLKLEAFRRGVSPDNIFEATLAIEALQATLNTLMTTEVSGFMDAFTRGPEIARNRALMFDLQKQLETLREQSAELQRVETATARRANEVRNEYRERQALNEAHAQQVVYMGQTRAESDRFVESLARAYGLMAQTRTAAAEMASQVRDAANAWLNTNNVGGTMSGGGSAYLANQYALYGRGRVAGQQAATSSSSLYTPYAVADSGGKTSTREKQIRKEIDLTKELTQVEKDRQTIIKSIEGSLEDGFMAMVEGTESVKDAFKKMAYEIIKELYRVLVVQRMVGGISGGIGMMFGASTGSFGLPFGRASGGSIMPNQPYLVGEQGPELVIPRHSGTVVNANQTSGALAGGESVTIQNNITVTGSDAAMVRAEVAKMIPQITQATKSAVIDAKQRGGQMAAAFR